MLSASECVHSIQAEQRTHNPMLLNLVFIYFSFYRASHLCGALCRRCSILCAVTQFPIVPLIFFCSFAVSIFWSFAALHDSACSTSVDRHYRKIRYMQALLCRNWTRTLCATHLHYPTGLHLVHQRARDRLYCGLYVPEWICGRAV